MSNLYLKTEYEEIDSISGSSHTTIKKNLYAWHDLSRDHITIYDHEGNMVFHTDEEKNSIGNAMIRLLEGDENIEHISRSDLPKGLFPNTAPPGVMERWLTMGGFYWSPEGWRHPSGVIISTDGCGSPEELMVKLVDKLRRIL